MKMSNDVGEDESCSENKRDVEEDEKGVQSEEPMY